MQADDGIEELGRCRGRGEVYKGQGMGTRIDSVGPVGVGVCVCVGCVCVCVCVREIRPHYLQHVRGYRPVSLVMCTATCLRDLPVAAPLDLG